MLSNITRNIEIHIFNISGHQTASKLLQLRRYFKDGLSFTLTPLPYNNQPSRIIHLLTGEQIR